MKKIFKTTGWMLSLGFFLLALSATGQDFDEVQALTKSVIGEEFASSATILENGMEVVLIENRANPMVACFVIVRSGQRDENEEIAGAGHFLEHAIFDGTEHRSKKQLYDDFDLLGSYVNASTKHDYTEFFILSPKETFVPSLDLLRDMIFHSVFPPDTLEQERGIVLEEIKRDFDRPTEKADNLFSRIMYKGTPYAHSILGSEAGLMALSREKLLDFYHTYYVPNNMICVVIGDIKASEMAAVIDTTFGRYAPGGLPKEELLDLSSLFSASANHVIKFRGDVDKCYLRVGIEVPTVWSEDYYAARVAAEMLDSYLQMHQNATPDSSILDISIQYFEDRDFATLNFYIDVPDESLINRALVGLFQMLSSFSYWVTEDRVTAAVQSHRSRDILQGQRLHMYGMMNSQIFAQGGYPLWKYHYEHLENVSANDVMDVADKYLNYPPYIATCLVPYTKEVIEQTATTGEEVMLRDTLDNGMIVVIRQDRDAPIFSAHLLAKGRALREGSKRAGYADLLHRILGRSLVVEGVPLEEALRQIGAEFEVTDNPYIPYDDYRTSPTYSFLRLECLDDFSETAINLLGEIVTQTPITEDNFTRVQSELLGIISSKQASVSWAADRLFLTAMLGVNHPLAQPEFGSMETISSATVGDIISFYTMYFSGSNLVLTVITSQDPHDIMKIIDSKFASLPYVELPSLEYPDPSEKVGRIEKVGGKKQSAIRLGVVLRQIDPRDRAVLEVWNRWVSDQLAFVIREEKGWAYSIGSTLWFVDDWALWEAGWGTSPSTADTSISVARSVLKRCVVELPNKKELQRIVNQMLRSEGMRRMMRINQAMLLGLTEMDGVDRDWDRWSEGLRAVTMNDIGRVVKKYYDIKRVVEVVVR